MQNNVKSSALGGGKSEQDKIPLIGINGFRRDEVDEAEEKAWEQKLRWLGFWYWPGWTAVTALGQVLLLAGLFLYSGPLIRWFDPTAGVLDAGILSLWLLAILIVDAFVVSAWLLLRLIRNSLTEFYEWDVEQDDLKKGLSSCLEAKIICGSFWALVCLFVGLFVVLL